MERHEIILMKERQDLIFIFKYVQLLLCRVCIMEWEKGLHNETSYMVIQVTQIFKKLVFWIKVLAEKKMGISYIES